MNEALRSNILHQVQGALEPFGDWALNPYVVSLAKVGDIPGPATIWSVKVAINTTEGAQTDTVLAAVLDSDTPRGTSEHARLKWNDGAWDEDEGLLIQGTATVRGSWE